MRKHLRREFRRHRVDTEFIVRWAVFERFPCVNAPEMPSVRKCKHTLIEFESDIDVYAVVCLLVRSDGELLRVGEENQVAIEAKMHLDRDIVIEYEKQILAFPLDGLDTATREQP